jgi:hypothetical protein
VNNQEVLQKIASDLESPAASVERWALPEQKALPLDTPEFAARSAIEFDKQASRLTTMDKLACARRIDDAVDGYAGMATKIAGDKLSLYFRAFVSMRKTATANLYNQDLDNLIEVAEHLNQNPQPTLRQRGLDKVAAALDSFDRQHGIDIMWDEQFPNPAYSVYGTTLRMGEEPVEDLAKVASVGVSIDDLTGFNWDSLSGKLEPEIVDGMKSASAEDKMSVFKSLPMPHREIITQAMRG